MGAISKNLSLVEEDWLRLKELLQKIENREIESDSEIVQKAIKLAIESLEKQIAKLEK